MGCVNIKAKEFTDALERLNISQDNLKLIVYKFQNSEYGDEFSFPSDEYIIENLYGTKSTVSTYGYELYNRRYSKPLIYDSIQEMNNAIEEASKYFDPESITSYIDNNDKYVVLVNRPILKRNDILYSKKTNKSNKNSLAKIYKESIDVKSKEIILNNAVKSIESLYNNFTPKAKSAIGIRNELSLKAEEIRQKFDNFVDEVKFEKLENGKYKFNIIIKNIDEIVDKFILDYVGNKSEEEILNELNSLEDGTNLNLHFYINKKKENEAREIILRKNNFITKENLNEAIQYLQELENNPDLNQYALQCLNWLKENKIILPRDGEFLKDIFLKARKHGIDTQKFKNPFDLVRKILESESIDEASPVDPNRIKQFSFNSTVSTKHGTIHIYDVEDSIEGQTAVAQVLADTTPKSKLNGEPIIGSQWCLSTYNYNKETGKATLTNSAIQWWGKYDQGKRQIAFLNGFPVAFNSSSRNKDEWWDFNDGRKNDRKGWDNIEDIDVDAYKDLHKSTIERNDYNVQIGDITYESGYFGSDVMTLNRAQGKNQIKFKKIIYDNQDVVGRLSINNKDISYADLIEIKKEVILGDVKYSVSTILTNRMISNGESAYLVKENNKYFIKIDDKLYNVPTEIQDKINKYDIDIITDLVKKEYINLENNINNYAISNELLEITENIGVLRDEVYDLVGEISAKIKYGEQEESNDIINENENILDTNRNEIETTINENNIINELNYLFTPNSITEGTRNEDYIIEEIANENNVSSETVSEAIGVVRQGKLSQLHNDFLKEKVNKQLSKQLFEILNDYGFEIVEGDLTNIFGEDILGATDFFEKVIYLANEGDRNAITDAEEFSHAFIELMGSKYRKPAYRNKFNPGSEYSKLRDLLENTSLYQEVFEQYKDTYVYENNSRPDKPKILKEAMGKALAATLNNRYEVKSETDKSFFNKLKQWFKDVLQWFKGLTNNEEKLIYKLNKISDSILDGSYAVKILKDSGLTDDLSLMSYAETLRTQTERDGGKALEIMQNLSNIGLTISGSLAVRAQGTLYRKGMDSLHDLDYAIKQSVHGIQGIDGRNLNYINKSEIERIEQAVENSEPVRKIKELYPEAEVLGSWPSGIAMNVSMIIAPESAKTKFKEAEGNYAMRLEALTEEERNQTYLLDLFHYPENVESVEVENIQMQAASEIFKAKFTMGRNKDLFDYRRYVPYNRNIRTSNDIMYQKPNNQQDEYTPEMQAIKDKAIADGTFMKVRNPKTGELVDSNLNEKQWIHVRTQAFKEWFGDWENDPANASKVVDENGEPLVVYHSSDSVFNEFDTSDRRIMKNLDGSYDRIGMAFIHDLSEKEIDELIEKDKNNISSTAIYASSSKEVANSYAAKKGDVFEYYEDYYESNADHINEINGEIRSSYDERFNFWTNIKRILNGEESTSKEVEDYVKRNPLPKEGINAFFNYDVDKRNFNYGTYKNSGIKYIDNFIREQDGAFYNTKNPIEITEDNYNEIYGSDFSLFLNIKNPLIIEGAENNWNSINFEGNIESTRSLENIAKERGHDGVIVKNIYDIGGYGTNENIITSDIYSAINNANQAKSATDNIGTYSTIENDIYKQEELSNKKEEENLVKLKSKNTWRELVKNYKSLEGVPNSIKNKVIDKLMQQINEESNGYIHENIYNNYFDTVNENNESTSSIEDVLNNIIKNSTDNDVKYLAQFIKQYINKNVANFKITYNHSENENERGSFDYATNSIAIHMNAARGLSESDAASNFEKVILHEIVHAITVDYISNNVEAKREIAELMAQMENSILSDESIKIYALKSVFEFIAEVMSKPTLREAMKLIPYQDESKNIKGTKFSRFIKIIKDIFKSIFGKKNKDQSDTSINLYMKAMDVIEKIMKDSYSYQGVENTKYQEKEVYKQENLNENSFDKINQNESKTILYKPENGERENYTIIGNKAFDPRGNEVIDETEKRKIFANLAIQEKRAIVVDYNGVKYIVNNRNDILSTKTGNLVWVNTPENANRLAIIDIAKTKFDILNGIKTEKIETSNDVQENNRQSIRNSNKNIIKIKPVNTVEVKEIENSDIVNEVKISIPPEESRNIVIPEGSERALSTAPPGTIISVRIGDDIKLYALTNPAQPMINEETGEMDAVMTAIPLTDEYMQNNIFDIKVSDNNIAYIDNFNPGFVEEAIEESKIDTEQDELIDAIDEVDNKENDEFESIDEENNDEINNQIQLDKKSFMNKTNSINQQIDNLLNNDLLTATEVHKISKQIAWQISDYITEIQTIPGKAAEIFGDKFKDIDFSNMSRIEVVKTIGPEMFYITCRENLFGKEAFFEDFSTNDKADIIYENFDAMMKYAEFELSRLERFSLTLSKDGKIIEVNENITYENDDFNESNKEFEVAEREGTAQQHWQIDIRTIDRISTMSEKVKRILMSFYDLDKDGNPKMSEFNIKERVDLRDMTNSILRWVNGSTTYSAMLKALKSKVNTNPWVSQLIDKLEGPDVDSDFQAQFFGHFFSPFQLYSVVVKEKNEYVSMHVNEHPALTEVTNSIKALFDIGQHPLFIGSSINPTSRQQLGFVVNNLNNANKTGFDPNNEIQRQEILKDLDYAFKLLGFDGTDIDMISNILTKETFDKMRLALFYINKNLKEAEDNNDENYNPFDFNKGIKGNIESFLTPITDILEDTALSSFYSNGKMYQSYVQPSYLTKLILNLSKLGREEFEAYVMREFGRSTWFKFKNPNVKVGWRNKILEDIMKDDNTRGLLKHKVQLLFDRKSYMKGMDDIEYTLSIFSEYFSSKYNPKNTIPKTWYRVSILSNKPSAEYIQFYSDRSENYQDNLALGFESIFQQELSRIQTVEMRNLEEDNHKYIKSFDKNGRRFVFLNFLNKYLDGKVNTEEGAELGALIRAKLNGEEIDDSRLSELVNIVIKDEINERANIILDNWEKQGILRAATKIQNIGPAENVEEALRNFIWNDTFFQMEFLQLTIDDLALYDNAVDLQKRIAQIHAPGIKPFVEVKDYGSIDKEGKKVEPKRVSDGFHRVIKLRDQKKFISDIADNIEEVFNRKIRNAKTDHERQGYEILKESLVGATGKGGVFRDINVTDGQAFNSPTSYRKKAFMFGKWSKEKEELWRKIINGEKLNFSDYKKAFGEIFKPFEYGQIFVDPGVKNAPLNTIKTGVQYKDSEYLLIMADAILKGEETGKPNILRAIYEIMEDSHFIIDENGNKVYREDGIDTVMFESAVKTGNRGIIDLNDLMDVEYGETAAKNRLISSIYNEDGSYNLDYVDVTLFEDFSLQQEVPDHFKNHNQPIGSQSRYLGITDVEHFFTDADGNVQEYMYNTDEGPVNATEFKRQWEEVHAKNIKDSLNKLAEKFGLNNKSVKERNEILSKILQDEIIRSGRHGMDMFQACSVDPETGRFKITPGDPIQSKRIEQLVNSIIKNEVNEQEIPGGPAVQVSNFGTSKKLNIRFKDKNGNVLKSRSEFNGTDSEYKEYVKNNQAGIAYFEAFVSIYNDELLKRFLKEDGSIDIETMEMLEPDLLKLVGYRIPTEDKYSMVPIKIVGFLPREAGDAIILPDEITGITGADFDVDKMYLMRKSLHIEDRFEESIKEASNEERKKEIIKENKKGIEKHLLNYIDTDKIVTDKEKDEISRKVHEKYELERRAEERRYNENLRKIEERAIQLDEASDNATYSNNEEKNESIKNKVADRQDKSYERAIEKENKRHQHTLDMIQKREDENSQSEINKEVKNLGIAKAKDKISQFLKIDIHRQSKFDNSVTRELRKAYLNYVYKVTHPSMETREGRNNKILDMYYEILTHETSADKVLNPQNFDQQKKIGYMIEAKRSTDIEWSELENMSIKELKKLIEEDLNLAYIDTQIRFYKQNAAASSLLGIFAVARLAHAVLESGGIDETSQYFVDINGIIDEMKPFLICGMSFGGYMQLDPVLNENREYIGKILGSLVGTSADASKDPILNLMNINKETVNVLNTLLRLGLGFEKAALLLSQPVLIEAINEYNMSKLSKYKKNLGLIIYDKMKEISDKYKYNKDSSINNEDITKEELINGLKERDDNLDYKVLRAFRLVSKLANAIQMPTLATRFNSISSAPGPLLIDNLIMEHKIQKMSEESRITDKNGEYITIQDILDSHPILNEFKKGYDYAREIFGNIMPANSLEFRTLLGVLENTTIEDSVFGDRRILSDLSDFYQSFLAVANGVFNEQDLNYYINEFPKEYAKGKYIEKYGNNDLIKAIKLKSDKKGFVTLEVNTKGLKNSDIENIKNGWVDLYKINPQLTMKLIAYNFFRGGIGFNPKSFLNTVPTFIKERIENYNETYIHLPFVDKSIVIDQFVRNNWHNNELVPWKKFGTKRSPVRLSNGNLQLKVRNLKYADTYFKITEKVNNEDVDKLYRRLPGEKSVIDQNGNTDYYVEYAEIRPLGNNRDYVEIHLPDGYEPIATTNIVEERADLDSNNDLAPIDNTETDKYDDESSQTELDAIELLSKMYISNGMTKESFEENVDKLKEDFKNDVDKGRSAIESFMNNQLIKMGIKPNEETLKELLKLIC